MSHPSVRFRPTRRPATRERCGQRYNMRVARMKANIEIDAGGKTFAAGLLADLIAALRRSRSGDLLAITSGEVSVGADLEAWCRFTGNTLVESSIEAGRTRWVIRCGEAPANPDGTRPLGSRLWLYANFDCNLCCDYCCVRSSPMASRRALGLARVQRIAGEASREHQTDQFERLAHRQRQRHLQHDEQGGHLVSTQCANDRAQLHECPGECHEKNLNR